MVTASGLNEDVTLVYIRLVEQESREAAAALELIRAAFGSRAALRAALMIKVLKMEVQQDHWLPRFSRYARQLEDYPDILPLAKYAALCCLQKWEFAEVELEASGWAELAMAQV